jgi:regulator of replication initiation timing
MLSDEAHDDNVTKAIEINDPPFDSKAAAVSFAATLIHTYEDVAGNAAGIDLRSTLDFIEASQMHSIGFSDKTHCQSFIGAVLHGAAETSLGKDNALQVLSMTMTGNSKGIATYRVVVNLGAAADTDAFEEAATRLVSSHTQIDRVEFVATGLDDTYMDIDLDWKHVSDDVQARLVEEKKEPEADDTSKRLAEMEARINELMATLETQKTTSTELEKENVRLRSETEALSKSNQALEAEAETRAAKTKEVLVQDTAKQIDAGVILAAQKAARELEEKAQEAALIMAKPQERRHGDAEFAALFADSWKKNKEGFADEWRDRRSDQSGKSVLCVIPMTGMKNKSITKAAEMINHCIKHNHDIGVKDNAGNTMLTCIFKLKRWPLLIGVVKEHHDVIVGQIKREKQALDDMVGDSPAVFFADVKRLDAKLYKELVDVFAVERPNRPNISGVVRRNDKETSVGQQATLSFSKAPPTPAPAAAVAPKTKTNNMSSAPTMVAFIAKRHRDDQQENSRKAEKRSEPPSASSAPAPTNDVPEMLESLRGCVLYFSLVLFEKDEHRKPLEEKTNERTKTFGYYSGNLYNFLAALWNKCAFGTKTDSTVALSKAILARKFGCMPIELQTSDGTNSRLESIDTDRFIVPRDMVANATLTALDILSRSAVLQDSKNTEHAELGNLIRELQSDVDYRIKAGADINRLIKLLEPLWTMIEAIMLEDLESIISIHKGMVTQYKLYCDLGDIIKQKKNCIKQYVKK